jgi:serine/threonine protein kinase
MDMQLERGAWTIGQRLPDGEGGFGQVVDVVDASGRGAVAKFVPKDPGAERELLFGDSTAAMSYRNVIPVLDKGEHGDQWVLVMKKADRSLAQHLAEAGGPLDISEAVQVLTDIATALSDLDGHIVHRDLKPGNVLRLDGTWCLADFGIARYAEDATATNTRKFNLTRPYAAPEQWRLQHATNATDMYAFGVIGYELLSGTRPFPGPDFRSQHLNDTPPPLTAGTLALRALVEECLWKPAAMRPKAANALQRLEKATQAPSTRGEARLAQVNQAESARLSQDHAAASVSQDRELQRAQMYQVAATSFDSVVTPLRTAIETHAPLAMFESRPLPVMLFVAQLRTGKIGVAAPTQLDSWNGPFDVIAYTTISVVTERNSHGYEGRSHSLWFCDAQELGRYSWYEVAFMGNPLAGRIGGDDPHSLSPQEASVALGGVTGTAQVAWPFTEIDRADPTDFVDRWTGWFADAADKKLQRPSSMPEKPTAGSWRRS